MRRGVKGPVILPEQSKGDARDFAGDSVGVSGKSVDFATKVIKSGNEGLIRAVDTGKVSVSKAARADEYIREQAAKREKAGVRINPKEIVPQGQSRDIAGKLVAK